MRAILTLVLTMMLLAAACASSAPDVAQAAPDPAERSLVEPAPTSTTTTTAAPTTTTTTIAPPLDRDGVARALTTNSGVVVPVVLTTDEGWVVRTPCQELAYVLEGAPIERVHVVVDPGHGGPEEPGAVAANGLVEAELNLDVAMRTISALHELGFEAVLTRTADYRIPIVSRVEIADTLEAALLISIHHQGGGDVPVGPAPGTEVYYQQGSPESQRFAGLLFEEATSRLGAFDIEWFNGPDTGATYRPNRDTGEDFYGMVRRPLTPPVLAEMAFMGNPAELDLLGTDEFRDAEAASIAAAVVRWFTTDDPGGGFVEPSFGIRSSGGGGGLGNCVDPDLGPTGEVPDGVVGEDTESG
ncbi:MAG: N-acetylmuramoyl-L-alanine amidase family protein [Acidimicrobiales bacterium]